MNWGTVPDWIIAGVAFVTALLAGLNFLIKGWATSAARGYTDSLRDQTQGGLSKTGDAIRDIQVGNIQRDNSINLLAAQVTKLTETIFPEDKRR